MLISTKGRKNKKLDSNIQIKPIDLVIGERQLNWLDHVHKMKRKD